MKKPMLDLFGLVFVMGLCAGSILSAQEPASPVTGSDPAQRFEQAIGLLEQDNTGEAIAILEELAQGANTPAPVAALLGAVYMEVGRTAEALAVLRPLAEGENPVAAVLYNAGRAARSLGQKTAAESYLRRAAELAPDSPAGRELGLLLGESRRYTEAFPLLARWARAEPEDFEARMAAAVCALEIERAPDAEEMLSDLPQDVPQVRLLWGRLLLLQGDPWGALATLKPALATAPSGLALELRRVTAEAHSEVGQAAQAVELLREYAGVSAGVALQLALAQYQSGDTESSRATLAPWAAKLLPQPAADLDPSVVGGLSLHFGKLLAKDGRHVEALPYLELSTRIDPLEKQGWQALGQSLAAGGRSEEARAALERFQSLSAAEAAGFKGGVDLRKELEDPTAKAVAEAMQLMQESRLEDALALMEKERSLAPDDLRPVLLAGKLQQLLGRLNDAANTVESALGKAPNNADALYLRGTIRMQAGNLEGAERDLRQALSAEVSHIAAMNDLAVILMDKNQIGEARQLLERVLELRPDDSVAAANLAFLGGG